MPLAGLRSRSSFKDIRNGDADGFLLPAGGRASTDMEGADAARPQSMRTYRDPTFWGSGHDESPPSSSRPQTQSGRPQALAQRRFSLKRFRHASDPQLSSRFRADPSLSGSSTPSAAPAPTIGVTAPTWDMSTEKPKRRFNPFSPKPQSFRSKSNNSATWPRGQGFSSMASRSPFKSKKSSAAMNSSFEQSRSPSISTNGLAPTSHGDGSQSLAVPPSRVSASSVSDQASDSQVAHASTATLPTTSSNSSTFFKFPRKKKKPKEEQSLFPLPVRLSPSNPTGSEPSTDNTTIIPVRPSSVRTSHSNTSHASPTPVIPSRTSAGSNTPSTFFSPVQDGPLIQAPAATFPLGPSPLTRHDSTTSAPVSRSPPVVNPVVERSFRGRSGTTTSFNSRIDDERAPTPFHESGGRNSMASTTLGRNSVAGLRSLTSRWRNASESHSPGVNSPGGFVSSKNNSFALSKETLIMPDREDGETPGKFYTRLEADMPKKSIALSLSKSTDPFHQDVLRSLMRTFKFYEEPMDISLRKFLWEIDLPGEAQQIDRVMSSFAERYHECNPHIFMGFDQAYLAAYSLIILHSDLFNKNNKRKMQRSEYQKNTGGHGIDEEILGYFYDNIQYTEFIAQNLDDDESERKSKKAKNRKKVKKIKVATTEGGEKGRLDPYDFILDDRLKLEVLRPALRGAMNLDDTFSYLGTSSSIDIRKIRSAFTQPGILQVISARSRPEAFSSPSTIENPLEAHPGVVDIKVAKVGVLWRKDQKRKKGRSPWQKWGTLLTQSQLYFFKNVAWVEDLMKQSDLPQKQGQRRSVVVFRPQIEEFKPDFSLRTAAVVALLDNTYDKHKNGFVLASYDGFYDETVLADSETDMNDWLAKINYCSAFASANIAMYATQSITKDQLHPVETRTSSQSTQSGPMALEETLEHPMARQINIARKEAIKARVNVMEGNMNDCQQKLEEHLKTARHLQILAPFPPKTRSDLLTFGARMAHRVRWSRFDLWRMKCHRDMLAADSDYENRPRDASLVSDGSSIKPVSPKISGRVNALSRLNSKASAIIYPQKSSKLVASQTRLSAASPPKLGTTQDGDIALGIDQAFATPAETLTKSATNTDSPYKLPPLAMGSGAISVSSYDKDLPESLILENSVRNNSTVSEGSAVPQTSDLAGTPPASINGREDTNGEEQRPSTAVEAEREHAFGSPGGRANVRRSLQRTLRDSREISGHHKQRRHKDSVSTVAMDDTGSRDDNETLPRGTGSFKVHGKKASVITLGSEWQGISPEERLRARKQAQAQDPTNGVSPVEERDGDANDHTTSDASTWEDGSSAIDAAPIAESDGEIVAYGQGPSKDDTTSSQLSSERSLDKSAIMGDEPGPTEKGDSWEEEALAPWDADGTTSTEESE